MPQPKTQQPEEPTAVDVAKDRSTPEPAEDAVAFTVEDYRARGHQILGNGFTQPDILAALGKLPKTRRLEPSDAKARITEWLNAPIHVEPPIEETV